MFPWLACGSRRVTHLNPHELSHGFMCRLVAVCTLGKYIKNVDGMWGDEESRGGQGRGVLGLYGQVWCPDSLTYFFVANATGSERRDPLIIGKAFKPQCFKKKTGHELGFDYKNNAKAWMTSAIYSAYLGQWDAELCTQGQHILYLHDNFSGHTVQDNLTNIRCEFFAPNLTAHGCRSNSLFQSTLSESIH